jgi:hypothetical protein
LFQLPCLELKLSEECSKKRGFEPDPFSDDTEGDEQSWGDDDWGKNEVEEKKSAAVETGTDDHREDIDVPDFVVCQHFFLACHFSVCNS